MKKITSFIILIIIYATFLSSVVFSQSVVYGSEALFKKSSAPIKPIPLESSLSWNALLNNKADSVIILIKPSNGYILSSGEILTFTVNFLVNNSSRLVADYSLIMKDFFILESKVYRIAFKLQSSDLTINRFNRMVNKLNPGVNNEIIEIKTIRDIKPVKLTTKSAGTIANEPKVKARSGVH